MRRRCFSILIRRVSDHWRLSGIHRDVRLYLTGTQWISDYVVQTHVQLPGNSDGSAVATVSLSVDVSSSGAAPLASCEVRAWLYPPSLLGAAPVMTAAARMEQSTYHATLCVHVPNACLWSSESPSLSLLVLELWDVASHARPQLLCVEACRVGMRSVCVLDKALRINGVPILIAGVNRHEHDQITGKRHNDIGWLHATTDKQHKQAKLLARHPCALTLWR